MSNQTASSRSSRSSDKKTRSGLAEFKAVLSDFRELTAVAVKGAIATPAVALILRFGPPPAIEIATLTSVAVFFATLWTFEFWRNLAESRLRVRMKVFAGLFCATLLLAGVLLATHTVRPAPDRDRIVFGYQVTPDFARFVTAPPTPLEALAEAEYDPYRIWTATSIAVVQVTSTILWVVSFVSAGLFVSGFAILHRRGPYRVTAEKKK